MTTPDAILRFAAALLRQPTQPGNYTLAPTHVALVCAREPLADLLDREANTVTATAALLGDEFTLDALEPHVHDALAVARLLLGGTR